MGGPGVLPPGAAAPRRGPTIVASEHGGVIPDDPEAIRALPGVGRYIAGAILSFAFDRPAPIVEANTQRVLARWLAWRGDLKSSATQARLWQAAERLVPPEGAGTFNQAFMELGALVCMPRAPAVPGLSRSRPTCRRGARAPGRVAGRHPQASAAGRGGGVRAGRCGGARC